MTFSLVSIEDRSLAYIRDQLQYARGLGQLVRRLDLDAGTVQAFLPSSDPLLATRYSDGALRDDAQEGRAVTALGQHLAATYGLTTNTRRVLICQFADGAQSPPEDGTGVSSTRAEPYQTVWLYGADESYQDGELWCADSRTELVGVVAMLRKALWFPAVGVLTTLPDDTTVSDGETLALDRLWPLVRDADVVLIGAWDAMNYLIWTPANRRTGGSGQTDA